MLKRLSFIFFLKVASRIIALREPGFCEGKFYYDSYFLSRVSGSKREFSIKGIGVYYSFSTWQNSATLKSAFSQLCITYVFGSHLDSLQKIF